MEIYFFILKLKLKIDETEESTEVESLESKLFVLQLKVFVSDQISYFNRFASIYRASTEFILLIDFELALLRSFDFNENLKTKFPFSEILCRPFSFSILKV